MESLLNPELERLKEKFTKLLEPYLESESIIEITTKYYNIQKLLSGIKEEERHQEFRAVANHPKNIEIISLIKEIEQLLKPIEMKILKEMHFYKVLQTMKLQ